MLLNSILIMLVSFHWFIAKDAVDKIYVFNFLQYIFQINYQNIFFLTLRFFLLRICSKLNENLLCLVLNETSASFCNIRLHQSSFFRFLTNKSSHSPVIKSFVRCLFVSDFSCNIQVYCLIRFKRSTTKMEIVFLYF